MTKRNVIVGVIAVCTMLSSHRAFPWPTVYPTGTTIYRQGRTFDGYTLYHTLRTNLTVLIDMEGNIVHTWNAGARELSELLPNGHILTERKGCVELDWNGNVVWESEDKNVHHDFYRLENGNMLLLSLEKVTDPRVSDKEIQDDIIFEVTPKGKRVWEWKNRDHLDELGLSDEAKRMIREHAGDWAHLNSMEPLPNNQYSDDPRFKPGNILVSYRELNVIAIIDRQTGKIVWRLGPEASETKEIGQIIGQHNAVMIAPGLPGEGDILLFDNGGSAGYPTLRRDFSRVLEINPKTMELVWQYKAPGGEQQFYSVNISGAQRLPNGNTLITEGRIGRLFEVTKEGEIVWEYVNPIAKDLEAPGNGSWVYRATRYPPTYLQNIVNIDPRDAQGNAIRTQARAFWEACKTALNSARKLYDSGKSEERP